MARGINKVILVGNLGADPELRYTGNNTAVCNMSVATNESYKGRDGNLVEKTEWHRVVAWDRLAEICAEYLKKGSQVYFEGSLQTRSWEDQDGNTRYMTEVKAREMMILSGRGESGGGGFDQSPRGGSNFDQTRGGGGGGSFGQGGGGFNQSRKPQTQTQQNDYGTDTFDPGDDELPF